MVAATGHNNSGSLGATLNPVVTGSVLYTGIKDCDVIDDINLYDSFWHQECVVNHLID